MPCERYRMPTSRKSVIGSSPKTTIAPVAGPAQLATARRQSRANELAGERQGTLPVWIRPPKSGHEFYSSTSRAKLYEWAGKGYIRSVSIREPGQVKGSRFFLLSSIFSFIQKCEAEGGAK